MSGERKALIVANDEYDHEGLRRLLAPAADAETLGRVLGDPHIGGFDVEVVHNQPAHVIYGRGVGNGECWLGSAGGWPRVGCSGWDELQAYGVAPRHEDRSSAVT